MKPYIQFKIFIIASCYSNIFVPHKYYMLYPTNEINSFFDNNHLYENIKIWKKHMPRLDSSFLYISLGNTAICGVNFTKIVKKMKNSKPKQSKNNTQPILISEYRTSPTGSSYNIESIFESKERSIKASHRI